MLFDKIGIQFLEITQLNITYAQTVSTGFIHIGWPIPLRVEPIFFLPLAASLAASNSLCGEY